MGGEVAHRMALRHLHHDPTTSVIRQAQGELSQVRGVVHDVVTDGDIRNRGAICRFRPRPFDRLCLYACVSSVLEERLEHPRRSVDPDQA